MYADVVVLTYQSPNVKTYTYKIPKNLKVKIGQLVSIPFGKRNPLGVVTHLRPDPDVALFRPKRLSVAVTGASGSDLDEKNIKPIQSITLEKPILLRYQIELLKWMSFYYFAPMVNCLESILPKLPSVKRLTTNATIPSGISRSTLDVKQTLVLVPNINSLPETIAKYPSVKNHEIYHNELKINERFNVWQKVLSGNADYIFGTRSAIFTPCPNLKQITIYDEHEQSYKDERSPYFDTLTVAEKTGKLTGAKIKIIDSSPKISTYFNFKDSLTIPKFNTKVEVISMIDEKKAGNKTPISDKLAFYIKAANQKNKKVLLFLNKKSDSGHIYCKSCKHNQFVKLSPTTCPKCNSPDIWFNSLNIKSLATLVESIVPKVKINLIAEGKNFKKTNTENNIDIATASVIYSLVTKKYDLVAHIATDSILNIPDFVSSSRAYTTINSLKKLTKGLLVLQTYNPEHIVIKSSKANSFQKFYDFEIKERRGLSYPPFSLLVKIILKGKTDEKLEQKAQKLFETLSTLPVTSNQQTSILGPYKSVFGAKNYKYNIILKIKIKNYNIESKENALKNIRGKYFQSLPKEVQVRIEPESIN